MPMSGANPPRSTVGGEIHDAREPPCGGRLDRRIAGGRTMLKVDGVSLSFGGVSALTDVSVTAARGEITAVIGPNGAGKTSLFNVISGFYTPQRGAVRLEGVDITRTRSHRRAFLGMSRTFQNIALFKGMSVIDNIKLGAHTSLRSGILSAGFRLPGTRREEDRLRLEIERDIIGLLQIDHVADKPVEELSYGLQKRVELARALVMRPKLLLLDEPVAGMNREEKEEMAGFVLDVREQWGTTVLLIEHDMGMVMDLSDRVVVLNFGRPIAAGTPTEIRNDPEVIRAYLGDESGASAPTLAREAARA